MLSRVDQLFVECGIEVVFIILPFQCGVIGLNGLDSTRLGHIITNGHSLCVSKLFMWRAPHHNIIGGSSVNHWQWRVNVTLKSVIVTLKSVCPSRSSLLSINIKHKL